MKPQKTKKGMVIIMKNCTELYEKISAYHDGELTENERLQVEDHINTCESCAALLAFYREISVAADESTIPVPETLLTGVMEKIKTENIVQIPNMSSPVDRKKKQRTPLGLMLTRYAPIAAGLVAVLLVWGLWENVDWRNAGSGSRNDTAAPLASSTQAELPDAADVADVPSADEYDYAEAEEWSTTTAGGGAEYNYDSAFNDSARYDSALDPAPEAAPAPMDITTYTLDDLMLRDENQRTAQEADEIDSHISGANILIAVTGEIPAILVGRTPQPIGSWFGWERVYEIPVSEAHALWSEVSYREGAVIIEHDNNSNYAIVLYSR